MASRRNLRSNGPVNSSPVPAARNQRSTRSAVKSAKGTVGGKVAGRQTRPLPRKLTKPRSKANAIGTDESFLSNRRWSKPQQSGEAGNETPHSPRLEPPLPVLSSGSSGSNFSSDENRKRAEFEKRYANRSDRPRTQEEDDISDEEDFIQDTLHAYSDRLSQASERVEESDHEDPPDEEDSGDGPDEEDNAEHAYKPGPVPAEVQERAHELYRQFQEGIQDLAKECGKSTDVIFNIVGYGPRRKHRPRPNRWSAFQAHFSLYGARKKPKTVLSAADWVIELKKEYELLIKERLGDNPDMPTNRDKCLEDIVKWYQNAYDDFVDKKKVSGKFKGIINKSLGEFMQLSNSVWELHKLHAVGFLINLDPDEFNTTHSVAFGASPAYLKFRESQKGVISKELRALESHLGVAQSEILGTPAVPFPIDWKRKEDAGNDKPEGNRDWERRSFSTHLITDIKQILYERGVSLEDCNKESMMHWVDWADYAYSRKVCLVNWPVLASKPGPGFKYKNKDEGIHSASIKTSLDFRDKVKVWSTHGPLNYIGVVSWSKEHIDLDDRSLELADVPLCINKAGAAVLTVKEAPSYGKKQAAAARRKKFYAPRPDSDDDDNENNISDDDDDDDDDDEEEEEEE
ncbi:hypothetical protein H0H92_001643, partial [Tricholoma furcatifolium]